MRAFRKFPLVLLAGLGAVQAMAAPYNRLYVFGDSYSDIGAGYVDCNGPTAVAYLAWHMGLDFTQPHAANSAGKSLDFAVSGARTGEGEGRHAKESLLGYGLMNQVRDFASRVQAGEIHFDPDATLFFIAGGLNDKALSTETTVANLRKEIEILKSLGGRHFTLALLPVQISAFSAVGKRLNPAIANLAQEGRGQLGVDLWLNHWGPDFDEVISHPAVYGIVNTTTACAGRDIFNEDTTPRGDPYTYFYYHEGHPSTTVHRIVGQKLYEEVLSQASRPQ
jgi:phospholipase/lecithinase/hemolysin